MNNAFSRQGLANSLDRMGGIYKTLGDLKSARRYYQKFLSVSEQLMKELNTADMQRLHSIALERMGDLYRAENNHRMARSYYERVLKIREELADGHPCAQYFDDAAEALSALSNEMLILANEIWMSLYQQTGSKRYLDKTLFADGIQEILNE